MNKGVHIIDNSNPAQPINKVFISIPGNIDIAVKGSTLYADMFTDLLSIDISDPLHARFVSRIPQVFPERIYGPNWVALSDTSKVIVDWVKKDTTVTVSATDDNLLCRGCVWLMAGTANTTQTVKSATGGVAGSMARFSIVDNYLYAVNNFQLNAINIETSNQPKLVNTVGAGWNIETIYPFQDKLFLGSSVGMHIFSIADPKNPVRLGGFAHARACDPVVTDGDYAYVTLRTGSFCMGTSNQLDVVNVKNLSSPTLTKTYPMTQPHGLAKDGNLLFICDGTDGLKVYDAADPSNIKLLQHLKGMETYDVIALQRTLMLVTKSGLMQYDYSNPSSLKLLSQLLVTAQ